MKHKFIVPVLLLICLLFCSCDLFGSHLSKKEIFNVVNNNMELLKKVPVELQNLNILTDSFYTTDTRPIDDHSVKIKGIYEVSEATVKESYTSFKNDLFDKLFKIKGIFGVRNFLSNSRPFIQFDCGAVGLSVSGSEYGFYYIADNKPIGEDGENLDFKTKGNGYYYTEDENSANDYYTERITDNWFYYESHD